MCVCVACVMYYAECEFQVSILSGLHNTLMPASKLKIANFLSVPSFFLSLHSFPFRIMNLSRFSKSLSSKANLIREWQIYALKQVQQSFECWWCSSKTDVEVEHIMSSLHLHLIIFFTLSYNSFSCTFETGFFIFNRSRTETELRGTSKMEKKADWNEEEVHVIPIPMVSMMIMQVCLVAFLSLKILAFWLNMMPYWCWWWLWLHNWLPCRCLLQFFRKWMWFHSVMMTMTLNDSWVLLVLCLFSKCHSASCFSFRIFSFNYILDHDSRVQANFFNSSTLFLSATASVSVSTNDKKKIIWGGGIPANI